MPKYAVYEHFHTFQGEGVFMGRAAYFIRFHACDQRCPWCDSAGTWHPDFQPENVLKTDETGVAELMSTNVPRETIVVLTGGEPTLYDLDPVIREFHARGHRVHLETAGHRPLPSSIDWVTLSPKPFGKDPLPESVARADEFKIIVAKPEDIETGWEQIRQWRTAKTPIWLHPEWSKSGDPDVLRAIIDAVMSKPCRFRAGWQVHKLYQVDKLDPNSLPDVPLGGTIQQ